MNEPLVTVLMSVYNGEKYLAEAIDSILNQTFTDFEFVIINDGSSDSSRDIILSYNDPRIVLVDNEQNIGLTRSLNKGISIARGKYIARMDADDISLPERLKKQFEFMEANDDVAVCGTGLIILENKKSSLCEMEANPEKLMAKLFIGNQLAHSSTMQRTEVMDRVGGYNEIYQYAQDYELWFRLLLQDYKLTNIPAILHKYRFDLTNISCQHSSNQELYAAMAVQYGFKAMLGISLTINDVLYFRRLASDRLGRRGKTDFIGSLRGKLALKKISSKLSRVEGVKEVLLAKQIKAMMSNILKDSRQ